LLGLKLDGELLSRLLLKLLMLLFALGLNVTGKLLLLLLLLFEKLLKLFVAVRKLLLLLLLLLKNAFTALVGKLLLLLKLLKLLLLLLLLLFVNKLVFWLKETGGKVGKAGAAVFINMSLLVAGMNVELSRHRLFGRAVIKQFNITLSK
jgi:hypothetical protein